MGRWVFKWIKATVSPVYTSYASHIVAGGVHHLPLTMGLFPPFKKMFQEHDLLLYQNQMGAN